MTKDEAITVLKANYPDACYSDLRRAVDVAIEELEKQIPVKCECITQVWGTFHEEIWRCPKCHKDAIRGGFYCWNCGQRLSWITKRLNEPDWSE